MKILFVNDFAPNFPGAFFESLVALSEKIHNKNNKLYYIFPLEREYIKRLDKFGEVYYCPSFKGKKFDWGLFKVVYNICKHKDIDIVHTNFGFGGPLIATLLSKVFKFHHIAHERNPSYNYSVDGVKKIKIIRARTFFGLLQKIGNTSYIAISSAVKQSLENYNGISPDKITVIPNAILSKRPNIVNEDQQKLKMLKKIKSSGNYIVGMTAHLGPQKDHKTLINAAKIVIKQKSNVHFVLIGGNLVNDKDNYREKIKKYIQKEGVDKNFHFLGEVQSPMPFVELCDIGCLISNWEGFGNALVEYMLKKKPVIGTAVGGINDIIDDGTNGFLVTLRDSALLAEKIIYLIENPQRAKEMGEKGYQKAIREYDMDRWVNRVIEVYESVLQDEKYIY